MSQKKKCQCYGPKETRRDPTLQVRKPNAGVFKSPRWFSYAGRPQPLSMETTLSNSVGFWCLTSLTHCLVLVFNKSYIFKHSSKFWGCCHKGEAPSLGLFLSHTKVRVSLSHLICVVTSITTFHEDGEPWLKDPWLPHALWRTQKTSLVQEFPRESLCSCFFFFFNTSWHNVMNYVWMAPNCVTDYIQFHHKLLIRFTPAKVPPGGSKARWVGG